MSAPNRSPSSLTLAVIDHFVAPLFFVSVVAAWEIGCRLLAIPTFVLPAPSDIVAAMVKVPPDIWLGHIWATLRVAIAGYLIAICVSVPLAVVLTSSRLLTRTVFPLLIVIQSTPVVAIAPILVVTMGTSDTARILITFLISFFPIVVSSITGLRSVPEEIIDLSRSLKAPYRREITQIRLPYALPHIFSGMKVSTTLSIIGAVVAELVAANQGLGFFIAYSMSMFRVPAAFAGLVVLVVISLLFFRLVVLGQKLVAPWSD